MCVVIFRQIETDFVIEMISWELGTETVTEKNVPKCFGTFFLLAFLEASAVCLLNRIRFLRVLCYFDFVKSAVIIISAMKFTFSY